MDNLIKYESGFESASEEALIQSAQVTIEDMVSGGIIDIRKEYVKIRKAQLFFNQAEKALRTYAIDEQDQFGKEDNTVFGVDLIVTNGTERLNYNEDHVVEELETKLKERKALVKASTATTNELFDSEGVEVTKVSKKVTGRNISATIK